jgi:uncharacterized protein (DUF2062 family)
MIAEGLISHTPSGETVFLEAVARYRDQVRADLEAAVAEEVGARDIATSFAVGTFVTMLPTLGTGLVVLGALVAIVERANGPAMFASVAVFNPFVKLGVYAGSFSLGSLLLGPVPGVTAGAVSLSAGSEVLARLVVGNLLLALVVAGCCYVLLNRFTQRLRERQLDIDSVSPDPLSR